MNINREDFITISILTLVLSTLFPNTRSLCNSLRAKAQSANPVWTVLLSGSPSSAAYRDLYDVIDSSWVSIRFWSRVFRFYSTDCVSGRHYVSSQIFPFFLCIGAHAVSFVGSVCSINLYLLVPGG
jgi:hypothetical protein